jgi:hypothetical protein
MKEEHTTLWPKEKNTKKTNDLQNITHKTKERVTRTPRSCSTSDTSRTVHSVPISTKVVSSNPIDGEVIQVVSDLRHVGGYLLVFRITPSIKLTTAI